jgi:biotin carboxylase
MSETGRCLLILGGGTMQLPAIDEARTLGLTVHVADGNAACPGSSRCDEFHHVDLRDRDGLLACGREISGLAGVFTAGTDFSSSVAWVAEHLGLPGIPYETSLDCTDKGRMRRTLAAAGVRVPAFRILREGDETASIDLELPVVVKPADNMGARGVRLVEGPDELSEAIAAAQGLSTRRTAIVEERIPGREYSLDAIVVDGRIQVTGIAERHIHFPPWFVELGHTIPADLSETERELLEDGFRRGITALGISRGAAKGDLFLEHRADWDEPRVTIGEIAARLSGGYMSGWTYPLSSGVSPTRAAILVAIGETPPPDAFAPTVQRVVTERALISAPGTVASISTPQPGAGEYLFLNCRTGDVVGPPRNNVEKVANAITFGVTTGEAEARAAELLGDIDVRLRPGDPETDAFLFRWGRSSRWARYSSSDDVATSLQRRPAFRGSVPEVRARLAATGTLSVAPLLGASQVDTGLESRIPGATAQSVLESLVKRGGIIYEYEGPAADGAFWSAFLAAGLQGYHYLVDSLIAEVGQW